VNLLIHGDCQEVLPTLDIDHDKTVLVSDPPFNIGYHYKNYQDKMSQTAYDSMLVNVFANKKHVLIHYPEALYQHAINISQAPERVISWVYNSNTAKQHRDIAYFGIKPDLSKVGQDYKNPNDKRIAARIAEGKKARLYDWWQINQVKNVNKDKTSHPCQMPLEVMLKIIAVLPDDYVIIDPFMGSGTTGVACAQLKRHFIGIEIDNEYLDIARQRIEPHL
jgi:DNA modification methylase